jgi:glycosyltransferase involved in cell wall biosynthesis
MRRDPLRDPLTIAVVGTRGVPSAYSGLETSTETLYAILAARGHDVTVYCRAEQLQHVAPMYRGMKQVCLPAIRRRSVETLSHVGFSLAHATLAASYDLLHLQALAPGLFAPLQPLWRAATVATIHGLDWQRAKWAGAGGQLLHRAERSIVRHIENVTVVSRDLQRYFRETYGKETVYIPNGMRLVDERDDVDRSHLAAFGLTAGRYIVYVGRLVPEKRVEELIRAFRGVDGDYRLALVGEGAYAGEYVSQLRAASAGDDRVVFTGRLDGAALRAVFSSAAMFVNPSELEGLPNALLEAIEYQIPVVASAIPPHREVMDGVAGYDLFFPVGDAAALRAALLRVIARREHYQTLAERVRAAARREYSWDVVADRTEALYREVVARRMGAPNVATSARTSAPVDESGTTTAAAREL